MWGGWCANVARNQRTLYDSTRAACKLSAKLQHMKKKRAAKAVTGMWYLAKECNKNQ